MTWGRPRALAPVCAFGVCAALATGGAAWSGAAAGEGAAVACAQIKGEAMGPCTAEVARDGEGGVTVTVTFKNGFARRLSFTDGRFMRADTTMSGTGRDTDWRLEGGIHHIRVEDQRYEVPQALVEAR